jgi:hypothetical protein
MHDYGNLLRRAGACLENLDWTLLGRSNWFLILAGIGAPICFFLMLFAARPSAALKGAEPVAPGANP